MTQEQAGAPGRGRRTALTALALTAAAALALALVVKWGGTPPRATPGGSTPDPGAQDLLEAIAETGRLDPGWRLEALLTNDGPPPGGENAARVLDGASDALPRDWRLPSEVDRHLHAAPLNQRLTPALAKRLAEAMPPASAALNRARELATRPPGRLDTTFEVVSLATRYDRVEAARRVRGLLNADAALRGEAGDVDGALASATALLGVGRAFGDEPTAVVQLERAGAGIVGVRCCLRALAQGEPSAPALRAALGVFADEAERPALLVALRGERALTHDYLEGFETGKYGPEAFRMVVESSTATAWRGRRDELFDRFTGHFLESHAAHLRWMNEVVEIARRPPHERSAALSRAESRLRDSPPLARILTPNVSDLAAALQRTQALLRCGVAAMEAELHRLERGGWPERLADPVPSRPPSVHLDPYDGRPLRLGRVAEGLLIYTVGPDGRDDGGSVDGPDGPADAVDVGVRVWDPRARRRVYRRPGLDNDGGGGMPGLPEETVSSRIRALDRQPSSALRLATRLRRRGRPGSVE